MVRLLWSHAAQMLELLVKQPKPRHTGYTRQAVFSKSLPANSKSALRADPTSYQPNCSLVELGNRHESCADS